MIVERVTRRAWLGGIALIGACCLVLTCSDRIVDGPEQPAKSIGAKFAADVTSGPAPLTVRFTDSSRGEPEVWLWRFGDGQIAYTQNPTHVYSQPGSYRVTLVITQGEVTDSLVRDNYIVVTDPGGSTPPEANFTASPDSGAAPLTVQFGNSSTGTITSYEWDFGDGQTATTMAPEHVYQDVGTYTVRLVVTGPASADTLILENFVKVTIPPPVAAFTATPTSGEPPLEVQFTSQSTGNITSYQWAFGDGGTSTAQNPQHTYTSANTYSVRLIVAGPGGADTLVQTNIIAVSDGAPVASFTGVPTSGAVPLTVQFANNSAGNITSYSWSFGNGASSTAENPSVTYSSPGAYTVRLITSGPGGTDTLIRSNYITVTPAAPTAGFTGSPTAGSAPLNVQFDNTSTGQITSYAWNFGDGSTSNAAEPSHTYTVAGQYTVRLIVTGPGGSDTLLRSDYISVTAQRPTTNFTGSPTSGSAPLAVQFTNSSTGIITSYSWRFGDGATSTTANPSHTYQSAGTYDVWLITTGPGGSDTLIREDYITVTTPAPVANFTATPTSGNAPLAVAFSNISTGQVTSRSWSFGDGTTSTAPNPQHTYEQPGTYTVRLIVSGPGGTDTLIREDYVTVTAAGPTANFTGSPTSGVAPLEVQFDNTSSGSITSYRWLFGDGTESSMAEPAHTYQNPGTYDVALIVTGPGGTDTLERNDYITVTPPPPTASFTGAPTSGDVPLTVQFLNTSSGEITGYSWSFGDGGTSTSQSPSHTYNSPGTHTVRLIVSGPGGADTLIRSDYIVVNAGAPVAGFTASPTSGTAPLTVSFDNTSSGSITSYQWNFGDGETSTAAEPTHTYDAPGTYTVSLTVTGPGGSDSEVRTDYIEVTSGLNASFTATPTSGVAPLFVQFTNTSTGDVLASLWSFGDGEFSTETNPAHVYENPGDYTVRLVVTSLTAVDTLTQTDFITVTSAPPVADFSASPTTGSVPLQVQFTDQSGGVVTSWNWDFGDGSTSTMTNPMHTYESAGTFTVQLIVTGPGGTDTLVRTNYVTTSSLGSSCIDEALEFGEIGPYWPTRDGGDCYLDDGDVLTTVSVRIYAADGGTELWAEVRMNVEEEKGDHSRGSLFRNVFLGYRAPQGYKINRILSPTLAEWSYGDKNDRIDQRSFPLATFRVLAKTGGEDLCGTTLDHSHLVVEFNTVNLEICQSGGDDDDDD